MMWKHRIGYGILWIGAFLLYVFYVGYTSYYLFLLVSSMPFLSIVYLILGRRKLTIRLHVSQSECKKDEPVLLSIDSATHSIIPLARIQATLCIDNAFSHKQSKETAVFTSERGVSEVTILLKPENCGLYTITLERVFVYDLLGLLRLKKACKNTVHFYVLPKPMTVLIPAFVGSHHDEETYDPHRAGHDTGEIFDVHTYRLGDSLHKIHWKLSAKHDDILVKDFSMPQVQHVTLAYEAYGDLADVEAMLGYVYGYSLELLAQAIPHNIARYVQGQCVETQYIQEQQDLVFYLKAVLAQRFISEEKEGLPAISDSEHAMYYVKKDGIKLPKKGVDAYGEAE